MSEPALTFEHETGRDPRCPGCDRGSCSRIFEKFSLEMWGCASCGLAFTHPIPAREIVASRYSAVWFEQEYLPSYGIDPFKPDLSHLAPRYDEELAPLEQYRKLNRILDVGAGAGLFLSQARRRGWEVHGVELSDFGPLFARIHFHLEIQRGTLAEANLPDGHFDVVMLQDTIEHVPDPKPMLQKVNRILRPGGCVVISTPNFSGLGRKVLGKRWALISPYEHLFLFGPRSMRAILDATGFEPARLETSSEVSPALTHGPHSARERLLTTLSRRVPRRVLKNLDLGDELFCSAVKR